MYSQDKFCVGMMNGDKATKEWNVRAELFEFYWPQSGKWVDKPRRLLWNHMVTRSPVCEELEEDGLGEYLLSRTSYIFSKS